MEIQEFSKVTGKGYNFKQVFQIYDRQFEVLRDFLLTLGDKYIVEEIAPGISSEIRLQNKYASGQLFLYLNNVLQWKGVDYEEVTPTTLHLLFERTYEDELKVVIVRSNVMQSSIEAYINKLNNMIKTSNESYEKAQVIANTLTEFWIALEQRRKLYTDDDVEAIVSIATDSRSDANSALRSAQAVENHVVWKDI